jgi:hypothetical protein
MYPAEFAPVLRDLLRDAQHPDIDRVETFEEADYTHKPTGVVVTMKDGTAFVVGMVGTAPPGGDSGRDPDSVEWRERQRTSA